MIIDSVLATLIYRLIMSDGDIRQERGGTRKVLSVEYHSHIWN
jgi:hypothetical protein